MHAHHGPARWHNLGERHRPSFHVPPVRQHLRSHIVLVWARLVLELVSRRSRDSRGASGRHRPGRRGRRRFHPRPWVSILPVHLPVEWPPPRGRETETAPTTKKLLRQNHHWPRRVSLSSLRRRTPRRGRHDPRDERREVGASSDAHPGPPIPVLGADRARRAHGVERLPAELRVVIVVAPVVRIDARRVDARGVVR